jgi:hypothetical protein
MADRYTLDELEEMSRESEAKLDVVVKVLRVKEKKDEEASTARSSLPEEKANLRAFVSGMDGQVLDGDINMEDVCVRAGSRPNQGNKNYAHYLIKQARLTYHSKNGNGTGGE